MGEPPVFYFCEVSSLLAMWQRRLISQKFQSAFAQDLKNIRAAQSCI
jgi:hypothetical protein